MSLSVTGSAADYYTNIDESTSNGRLVYIVYFNFLFHENEIKQRKIFDFMK